MKYACIHYTIPNYLTLWTVMNFDKKAKYISSIELRYLVYENISRIICPHSINGILQVGLRRFVNNFFFVEWILYSQKVILKHQWIQTPSPEKKNLLQNQRISFWISNSTYKSHSSGRYQLCVPNRVNHQN